MQSWHSVNARTCYVQSSFVKVGLLRDALTFKAFRDLGALLLLVLDGYPIDLDGCHGFNVPP